MAVTVSNTSASLSGKTLLKAEDAQTITGQKTFNLGAASPFLVSVGALVVANLDADKLDGQHAPAGTIVGTSDAQVLTNKTINGAALAGDLSGDPTFTGVPTLKKYAETKTAPAIVLGAPNTLTFDCNNGTFFAVALTANCTVTISNPPAAPAGFAIVLTFTADGTVRTITWPASVVWAGGVAPVMTGTNNKRDIITLMTFDGGVTWFGSVVGQNY